MKNLVHFVSLMGIGTA